MAIDWNACYESVLNDETQAEIWLKTELGSSNASWRWHCFAVNYPPRVVIMLGHKTVHDKRRVEAFWTWETCQTKPILKYLTEEELQDAGEIIARLADSLGLRAARRRGADEGELVYVLRPHYDQWEMRDSRN